MGINPAIVAAISADVLADLPAAYPETGREFSVVSRRNGETTFISGLGDHEMLAILSQIPSSFAADLLSAAYGRGLSYSQEAWGHKLANDWLKSQTKESTETASENAAHFAALATALAAVKGRSKSIKISADCMVSLSRCKGKVWVKNPSKIVPGNYGNGPEFLGSVTPTWGISDKLPDGVRQQILGFVDSLTR